MKVIFQKVKGFVKRSLLFIQSKFVGATKPITHSSALGTLADLTRSKQELIVENALLRQQLIVLNRQVKRPHFNPFDKFLLVIFASWFSSWK